MAPCFPLQYQMMRLLPLLMKVISIVVVNFLYFKDLIVKSDVNCFNLEGPGIENFQIIGDAIPGGRLLGCGFPVRGTSLCMFQVKLMKIIQIKMPINSESCIILYMICILCILYALFSGFVIFRMELGSTLKVSLK